MVLRVGSVSLLNGERKNRSLKVVALTDAQAAEKAHGVGFWHISMERDMQDNFKTQRTHMRIFDTSHHESQ